MKRKTVSAIILVAVALLLFACTPPMATDFSPNAEGRLAAKVSGAERIPGPKYLEGEIGPGTLYAIYYPEEWNGDLVLYAHGYTDPAGPLVLPPLGTGMQEARDQILARHFAIAFSSYKENGWAVQDAVIRTRQLIGLFTSKFGKPGEVFLMGHSMGGTVTIMLAEKNPQLISGALPMAGPIGGAQLEIDYVANVRILFDYFFPGVIRGDALDVPEDLNFYSEVVPAVMALFSPLNPEAAANVFKAMRLASVDQVAIRYLNATELAMGLLRALAYQVIGVRDMTGRTHGHVMTDNMQTAYTITGVAQPDINAGVDRFQSTPDAENYLAHYYLPDGRLRVPVLTLHKTRDADVPIFHEVEYARIAAQAGGSGLLVQRTIEAFGHSDFTAEQTLQAFDDLVAWVRTGVKPMP